MECLYPDAEQWDGRMDVVGEGWEKVEIARSSYTERYEEHHTWLFEPLLPLCLVVVPQLL